MGAWWLHWEWLPNVEGIDDFAKHILFDKNAEEDFIKSIINLIEIFELNNNLMTDINKYLNTPIEN